MAKTATIQTRVEPKIKQNAQIILKAFDLYLERTGSHAELFKK